MAQLRDDNEPIILFNGGQLGYGWAERPTKEAQVYHWTDNFDCRVPGRAYPSLAPIELSSTTIAPGPIVGVFEWQEASGSGQTSGRPILIAAAGQGDAQAIIWRLRDGTWDSENVAAIAPYTGAALFRYDQDPTADPDEEMAFFCNGSTAAILRRRKKDGTIDTGATATHTFKADGLFVVGSDLWASQGYKALKLTVNTDPGLTGSWGAGIPVGIPSYPINEIIALGTEPIVMKGDGVFVYDVATNEFQNLTLNVGKHPDNGKGGFTDGRGRAYYPTVDGDIIVFSIGFQDQQKPVQSSIIDRDTPWGRITALTADMEYVYAAVEPGQNRTNKGVGLVVKSDNSGVFTTHTTNVTDGQFATSADWTALSGTADFVYIGADEPFLGAYFELLAIRTQEHAVVLLKVEYLTSGSTWVDVTSTSHDSAATFMRDGLITLQGSGSVDLLNTATNPWVTGTVDSSTKYWMRISPNTGLGWDGVKCREVSIVPYRPPLHKDTPNAIFPISAYALAGALPKMLVGKWEGEEIIWQDVWTLDASRIDKIVVGRGTDGAMEGKRALYAMNWENVYGIPVGPDVHPSRAPWPKLGDYGESGVADDAHIIALSPTTCWLGNNEWKVDGDGIFIHVPHTQDADEWWMHYAWDEGEVQTLGPFSDEVIQTGPLNGQGRVLASWLAFKDGARSAIAPYLRWAEVPAENWEDLGPIYATAAEDISSPQFR